MSYPKNKNHFGLFSLVIGCLLLGPLLQERSVAMCAQKVADEKPDPNILRVEVSIEDIKHITPAWSFLLGELTSLGLITAHEHIDIPTMFLTMPEAIQVGFQSPDKFRDELVSIAQTASGFVYVQLLMRWCKMIGEQYREHSDALIFVSALNRPGLFDQSYPFEQITRVLFTVFTPIRDMNKHRQGPLENVEAGFLELLLLGTQPTEYSLGNNRLQDGYLLSMRGALKNMLGGVESAPARLDEFLFKIPEFFGAEVRVKIHSQTKKGISIPFYPFGINFFGENAFPIVTEVKLSGTDYQEVGGILSVDDDTAAQIIQQIEVINAITMEYAQKRGILGQIDESHQFLDPGDPPHQNN